MQTKSIILSILLGAFISVSTIAQANKVQGNWLLVKMTTPNEIEEPFLPISFTKEGKMLVMEYELGTWKIQDKKVNIQLNKKELSGLYHIQLKKNRMILEKKDLQLIYQKQDKKANEKFQLLGAWKQKDTDYYVKFELPNTINTIKLYDGATEESSGTWLFLPKNNMFMVYGFMDEFRGKNYIKSVTNKQFIVQNDTLNLVFNKVPLEKITTFSFVYDDFDEEADYQDKLPWRDFYSMQDYLGQVDEIEYTVKKYLPKIETFQNSKLIQKVIFKKEKGSIEFKNYSITNTKEPIFSGNIFKGGLSNRYNYFFPLKDPDIYRVLPEELITVPAGKFSCIVVEAVSGNDKIKFWMIKDKPGVYAKVIKQYFDEDQNLKSATIQELLKIK